MFIGEFTDKIYELVKCLKTYSPGQEYNMLQFVKKLTEIKWI